MQIKNVNKNVLAEHSPLSLLVGCLYPDSPGVLVPLTGPASYDPVTTGPPLPPVLLRPPAGAARGLGETRKQGFGIFTNQPLNLFEVQGGPKKTGISKSIYIALRAIKIKLIKF